MTRGKLVASARGDWLAIIELTKLVVIDVATWRPSLEVGIAGDVEAVFVRDRLVVLSRGRLDVIDVRRGTQVGELVIRGPARLMHLIDDLALVTMPGGTATIAHDSTRLQPLPVRGAVTAAGTLGEDMFVLATRDRIEAWDTRTRRPCRRLRRDRHIDPLLVGGSAQRLWMVPRETPAQIEVVALTGHSSRTITAPSAIRVAPQRAEQLFALCESGEVFAIDLARGHAIKKLPLPPLRDIAVLAGTTLACLGQDGVLVRHEYPRPSQRTPSDEPRERQVVTPASDLHTRLKAWRASQLQQP